eukprot:TRINITY_DN15540_c0_g1_i1.p1 TRINITY_DN15540_c0_g1~~TRINITY_DN15540_c0_g1_i1.p1  ORF type:complete len:993 (-),score=135.81 TRINITY_DN15540_c0_g1_i1:53-2974(-)
MTRTFAIFALCAIVLAVAQGYPPCTEQDWTPVLSNCNGGTTREMTFTPAINCTGTPPAAITIHSCDCTAFDYAPVYGTCTDGSMNVVYTLYTDCTGGVPPPAPKTNVFCQCPAGMYTPCNFVTRLRSLVYFMTPTGTCAGNVELPPSINNIPCNISCGAGNYLPQGQLKCAQCTPGTFSIGGGVRYTGWPSLYTGMSTYCSMDPKAKPPAFPCSGWIPEGTHISSGNNTGIDGVTSSLIWNVNLVTAGKIKFEYKVDAETGWDGLKFSIDDTAWTLGRNGLVSYTFDYTEYTQDVTPGFHSFKWAFIKDVSMSSGADFASLNLVELTGTDYNAPSCMQCPPGYFIDKSGAKDCQVCQPNTYAASSGTSSCSACAAGSYSVEGSTSCMQKAPCTAKDYTSLYTPCINGLRDKYYEYIQPQICEGGVLPDRESGLPCADCLPGMYRSAPGVCSPCAVGTWSAEAASQCNQCPAGTSAVPAQWFKNFEGRDLPVGWTSSCSGDCGSPVWQVASGALSSGVGHGRTVTTYVELTANLLQAGKIELNYLCSQCKVGNIIQVSSIEVNIDARSYPLSMLGTSASYDLPIGSHKIRFTFRRSNLAVAPGIDPQFIVNSVAIRGVASSLSGADKCTNCTTGMYAMNAGTMCSTCSPGTYSLGAAAQCSPCPADTFNKRSGQSSCLSCGVGTSAPPGSSACVNNCSLTVGSNVYDMSKMERLNDMYGPIRDNSSQTYFLNMCHESTANHTCLDANGNPIPSYACQLTNQGWSTSTGDVINFYPLPGTGNATFGLIVGYTNGDACSKIGPRSSNITLICDMMAGVGSPTVPQGNVVEASTCRYNFEWRSIYACPLCTAKDYRQIVGACTGGQKVTTYSWNPDYQCHDGVSLPATVTESCSEFNFNKGPIIGLAFGIVIALILLVVVVVVLYRRNRKLYSEYSLLRTRHEEMDFMPAHGDNQFALDDDGPATQADEDEDIQAAR